MYLHYTYYNLVLGELHALILEHGKYFLLNFQCISVVKLLTIICIIHIIKQFPC